MKTIATAKLHDPCSTCTLIPSTAHRPWPVDAVKRYGLMMLIFGLTAGIALGVFGTLLAMGV